MVMVLAAASVVALTACSAKPTGTYKFESVSLEMMGVTTTYNVGDAQGSGEFSEDSATLTLNKDGTYTFVDRTFVESTTTGTWEVYKDAGGDKRIKFDDTNNMVADYDKEGLTFRYKTAAYSLIYKMKKA